MPARFIRRSWLFPLILLAVFCAVPGAALHFAWLRLPPNWAPWGSVELAAPPGWLARWQINGLAVDTDACMAALDAAAIQYTPLPDRPAAADGCTITAGVRIVHSQVDYSHSVNATCALAAALYWYERDLMALARVHLGTGLVRIEQLGTHACRNVNNAQEGRRSQHATANAIDIGGFRLADGRTLTVLRHWGAETAEGRFLAAARDAACRYFNAVLGPQYDRAHANHFHLDLGRARICR